MEQALYYLWFVLALVFNSEKQAAYNCEANDENCLHGKAVELCLANS